MVVPRRRSLLLSIVVVLAIGCDDAEQFDEGETGEVELRARPDLGESEGGPDTIAGDYIVLLSKGANPHAAAAAVAATPAHVYSHAISGFAGALNHGQLEALARRPDVLAIEADQVVTMAATECAKMRCDGPVTTQPKDDQLYYGVDRIDQRQLPLSNSYTYTCTGEDVHVYVFDTGIHTAHSDFGGRADVAWDGFSSDSWDGEDCNGHGTHVSGIIGGTHYGVAKEVQLHAVKVLDCDGNGTWSKVLAGIDWVAEHGSTPAVVNMSLGGGRSRIVNRAVDNLSKRGVSVVVAAGNNDGNACSYSPSGAKQVIAVAANNSADERASFSNYGSCVDVYAAGVYVRSAWWDGGSRIASGTSMASPHVAGVVALYKQAFGDASSSTIKSAIEDMATADVIGGNPSGTVNRMVHWPCSGAQ